jgi:hypothetical protein
MLSVAYVVKCKHYMLSVVTLNVVIPSVVMLSVVAPEASVMPPCYHRYHERTFQEQVSVSLA